MPPCTLCDLPTGDDPHTAPDVDGEFCCRGCLAVARSLGDAEGLDGLDEVEERRPDAEPDDDFEGETTFLHVDGMHCATCESFLEMTAGEQAGVAAAEASYATDTIRVDYDPDAVGADELPERLSVAGYSASNRADPDAEGDDAVVRFLIGGGFFGMMAMLWYVVFLYPTYFGYEPFLDLGGVSGLYLFTQVWVFASIVLFYTGYPILRGAYVSLRARQPNMDLLVSLAAVSSYAYSTLAMFLGRTDLYFDVTIAVILVVTAGNHYESLIKRRATGALSELTTVTDREVRTEAGETVATDAVAPGDRLLVRPSERVPFDGIVAEGLPRSTRPWSPASRSRRRNARVTRSVVAPSSPTPRLSSRWARTQRVPSTRSYGCCGRSRARGRGSSGSSTSWRRCSSPSSSRSRSSRPARPSRSVPRRPRRRWSDSRCSSSRVPARSDSQPR